MKTIGIFGGSFNPIHRGHVALADALRRAAGLDEVWLMVSPHNPLKQRDTLLSDELRYQLARLALHGMPALRASNYEFGLPKPSYTWNTLNRLSADHPHTRFTLIIGSDNWQHFDQWHRGQELLQAYPVVVYPRRESPVDPATLPPGVSVLPAPLLDVSSTLVRQRVASRQPIDHLVPPGLAPLIRLLYGPHAAARQR